VAVADEGSFVLIGKSGLYPGRARRALALRDKRDEFHPKLGGTAIYSPQGHFSDLGAFLFDRIQEKTHFL
jgi:hypothetical protein